MPFDMTIALTDPRKAEPAARPAASGRFLFHGPGGTVLSQGSHAPIAPGTAETLERRLAEAFRDAGPGAVAGGALPFRRDRPDHLWRAARAGSRPLWDAPGEAAPGPVRLTSVPAPEIYADAVARAERLLRAEAGLPQGLRKIVLARTLAVASPCPIHEDALLARLVQDDSVTAFRVGLPGAGIGAGIGADGGADGGTRALVGATPELLLDKRGAAVLSHSLAGSARRHRDTERDARAAAALAGSAKDRREHAMVVEYILDTLAPLCRNLDCPDGTRLTATRSMWHLGTRIRGRLRDDTVPAAVLAARLHPTPAVCGLPPADAARQIARLEPEDRGFYAGAVGWCDARGDGAWHVAIRCAEICGSTARLFAGAGIVEGSDPWAETHETAAKFAAMLDALGLPGDAALTLAGKDA